MTVVIICIAYLAGDDLVFDAFRYLFYSELVQVRGGRCFITGAQTAELEVDIYLINSHLIYFFCDGLCWSCSDGGCRRNPK